MRHAEWLGDCDACGLPVYGRGFRFRRPDTGAPAVVCPGGRCQDAAEYALELTRQENDRRASLARSGDDGDDGDSSWWT